MIKELFSNDVERVVFLQREENFLDGWNENQFLSSFKAGNFLLFGIEEGERLVAFLSASFTVDTCDIEDVLVSANFRKKGYARLLISHLEKILTSRGIKEIFLEVRENNLPAISLYKACGFNLISKRKKYYQDGENALVYKKEI